MNLEFPSEGKRGFEKYFEISEQFDENFDDFGPASVNA